jgi:hypothetical protein
MRCHKCKEDDKLVAQMFLLIESPILKGGGIRPERVTTAQIRDKWLSQPDDKKIIVCQVCETQYVYKQDEGLVATGGIGGLQ